MKLKVFLAVLIGKLVRGFCRVVHRGGTGMPGRIALKICPSLLSELAKNTKCIIITGTNGKTTCTRIVEEGFKKAGLNCFANRSGANLIEGIATDFIVNSSLFGKCRYDYAVLETDEAASKKVCLYLNPIVILVTNLFRDQVDRFGSVLNTRDDIIIGIHNAPNAIVCLNGDCPVCASIASEITNRTVFFGIEKEAAEKSRSSGESDLEGCTCCGGKLEYSYVTFSHLGKYHCSECGFERPDVNYAVLDILSQNLSGSRILLSDNGDVFELSVNLPALYNIYNAAGSYAALRECGITRNDASVAPAEFSCGFGRMERFEKLGQKGGRMILVKNDAGCNQVLDFLTEVEDSFVLSIYLNNNISDGVDISWLDAAQFEVLKSSNVKHIYISGMRRSEMHDRLLRAGFSDDEMSIVNDARSLVALLNSSEVPVFIMPTYTGMMEARSEIIRQCGGSEFWEG